MKTLFLLKINKYHRKPTASRPRPRPAIKKYLSNEEEISQGPQSTREVLSK